MVMILKLMWNILGILLHLSHRNCQWLKNILMYHQIINNYHHLHKSMHQMLIFQLNLKVVTLNNIFQMLIFQLILKMVILNNIFQMFIILVFLQILILINLLQWLLKLLSIVFNLLYKIQIKCIKGISIHNHFQIVNLINL